MLPNVKQGNSTNNEWYERLNTKVDIAKSVGVSFVFETIWEYCAMEAHKATYMLLTSDEQDAVRVSARERFLSYALIKTSNSKHDKIRMTCQMTTQKGATTIPRPGHRR